MSAYSVIQKSQLEGALRLDAEYFMPEFLSVATHLEGAKTHRLDYFGKIITSAFYPAAAEYYSDEGLPFIRVTDIIDYPIIDETQPIQKLPKEFVEKSQGINTLTKGDLVISKVGTPCYTSLINGSLDTVALTRTVLGIKGISGIDRHYLLAFLRSKYGFFQLMREREQQIQLQLTLERVRKIKIFLPSAEKQTAVATDILEYYKTSKESKTYYNNAEDLFLEDLGLKEFEKEVEEKSELCWTVNFADVKEADRIDAEYFQPKYEKLIAKLKTQNSKQLTDVINLAAAKFDPNRQADTTFNYIELANVDSTLGIVEGSNEVLGKEAPSRAKRVLEKGDVIVSSIQGSLEKAALIDKDHEGFLASTGFFQFRSKSILSEVLLVLAKSFVFQMQLEKQCAGTILTAVPHESLKNIIVPILPLETQQKIADLIKKSHESRKKSKELLEEAKRKVEEMIESKDKITSKE